MTNDQASQSPGYQPNVTVGGAWGQHSGPHIGSAAVMAGGASADKVGDMQATTARLLENPDGRWFQGAQVNPRANSGPGVSTFVTPGYSSDQLASAAGRWELAAKRAAERNPTLSRSSTGALVGSPNPDFAPPTAEQLAQNKVEYDARRRGVQLDRRAAVVANAAQRGDARRLRMGDLTSAERLAMADPRGAQMAAAAAGNQQNELALQRERNQGAMGVANAEAGVRQQEQALAYRAQRLAAGATAEEVDGELAQYGGGQQRGVDLAQPGGQARPQARAVAGGKMSQKQWQDMQALPPEEWRQYLIGLGVTDNSEASEIIKEASGNPSADVYNPEGPTFGGAMQDVFGFGPASDRLAEGGYPTGPLITAGTMLYNKIRHGSSFGPRQKK